MRMNFLAKALAFVAGWLALAGPAEAAWLKAESPHFIVYGEGGEAQLRERVAQLEDFDALLRMLTGTAERPAGAKLTLYLVRGYGELRQVWPGAAYQTGGFYSANVEGVFALSDVGRGDSAQADEILFHEYAHHFLLQYFPGVYPTWYNEGFAEYLMTVRFEPDTIELGRRSQGRAIFLNMRWLPLEEVLWPTDRDPTAITRGQQYAQSWLLVHYLIRDRMRAAQMNRYLTLLAAGREPRAAFVEAFGTTPAQMQRSLQRYYRDGLTFSRLRRTSASAPPPVAVTALPASAERLLLADLALTLAGSGDARAVVERIRAAARGAQDAFSRRIHARAEALHGDAAVAGQLLEALLAEAPGDAGLLYLMGVRQMRGAGPVAAAGWFERAYRADPFHHAALFRHAMALAARGGSDAALPLMMRAHGLAPQVATYRINAAALLAGQARWDEAEAVLAPLLTVRHGGRNEAAHALLAKIRARDLSGLAQPPGEAAGED